MVFKYAFSSFIAWVPDILESLVTAMYFDKASTKAQDHSELCTTPGHAGHTYKLTGHQKVHAKAPGFREGQSTEIQNFRTKSFAFIHILFPDHRKYDLFVNILI